MGTVERKEREREARRGAILDAAETVFKTKGFASATMDDIAKQAELAKGTVYLYYRSKEELQVGLVMRGLDLLVDTFETVAAPFESPMDKLTTIGEAYRTFAKEYPFYFTLMNMADLPNRNGLVSPEMLTGIHERSNAIWELLTSFVEGAKLEGFVKPEVNAFTVTVLLWQNATGILRLQDKIQKTPDSMWKNKKHFNACDINFDRLYDLNARLLMSEIVTDAGRNKLQPIVWPEFAMPDMTQCDSAAAQLHQFKLAPFAEDFSEPSFAEAGL